MDIPIQYKNAIENPDESIRFFAIMPPSNLLAETISAMANLHKGGILFIGIKEGLGKILIRGLSDNFNVMPIIHKAVDQINPTPEFHFGFYEYNEKKIFALSVAPSRTPTFYNGNLYKFINGRIVESRLIETGISAPSYPRILSCLSLMEKQLQGTDSKKKVLSHYQSSLRLIDAVATMVMPDTPDLLTPLQDGRVLLRMVISAVFDNFEIYLGSLLSEIWMSDPRLLKSDAPITVREVLECSDIEEFVKYYARKRVSNMAKGSIKSFIKENALIKELNVLNTSEQERIDKMMHIRHLYTHQNGFIDERFARIYQGAQIGTEYVLSVNQVLDEIATI
ncbi:AlbA family DNA-binding domain-containing protein [Chitinophaga deserti]|uniref:AlbA family DNA-binding domain-containing protein n=1 Tax=Chitinophaga deserti TaxID=2164099 RepID=UPI000D6B84E9|nr:ATP-binding protein [Chitinophaga deserti]